MNATIKRTLTAALKAAQAVNTAADKLSTSTAAFVKAAGGHDAAAKLLGAQRGEGRTWKTEREENSPLWKVYNCVAVAKSRANPKKRKPRQAKADPAKADPAKADPAKADPAGKAATPADIVGIVLTWSPDQIAQAIRDQTTTLESTAVDTLKAVLGLLTEPTPAPKPAPTKRAPRKRAK